MNTVKRLVVAILLLAAQSAARTSTPEFAPQNVPVRYVPDDLRETSWLKKLGDAQVKAMAGVSAFHDFQFTDRLSESGITFRHRIVDDAGKTYKAAHYDHGNGLAIADVDGDGRSDIYFVNQVGGNELWRNAGGGRFQDITAAAGVGVAGKISVSASFADIDNDGDADLYVTTVRGGNVLFENDGKGRFRDISAAAGLGYVGHSSARGVLRLQPRWPARPVPGQRRPVHDGHGRAATATKYYVAFEDAFAGHLKPERAERSILYRNEGGNRFVDVSKRDGARRRLLVRRRQPDRRQRRWLARPVRAEHAGRRPVLRERRRQTLRQEEPRGVSADVVGRDGHQGVRLQQRRAPRHLHHRHALRHERADRPRAREDEVGR